MSQVNANEALRLRRLVFYAADTERIAAALIGFIKKAGALSVLLIDQEGHMVARQGYRQQEKDSAALAALVAGSFTSTRQVAKLLGEKEFRVLSHTGAEQSIHITLIGERTLQVAVFPSSVKSGMISVFCKELAVLMETIIADCLKRQDQEGAPQLAGGFDTEMKDKLDNLFGDL